MLVICTVLSVPSYVLFWLGSNQGNLEDSSTFNPNGIIFRLSLSSLGEHETIVNMLDFQLTKQRVEMFCETGVISEVTRHGVAEDVAFDDNQNFTMKTDSYCHVDIRAENLEKINAECIGNKFCEFDYTLQEEGFTDHCLREFVPTTSTTTGPITGFMQDDLTFFFEYECDISMIELPGFGDISRSNLANVAIACDALICLFFLS